MFFKKAYIKKKIAKLDSKINRETYWIEGFTKEINYYQRLLLENGDKIDRQEYVEGIEIRQAKLNQFIANVSVYSLEKKELLKQLYKS